MSLGQRLYNLERRVRGYFNVDELTPETRRRANIYMDWFDHAILRRVWTNFDKIAPDVFRSNQPNHKRFIKMKDMGIRTVLNLRGESKAAHYLVEKESCEELGLNLVSSTLNARKADPREQFQDVLAAFRKVEKPVLIHCKSGADRAGLASAMWLMVMENVPPEEARKMLSTKYAHLKWTKTGVLDYILDSYIARNARDPIGFEEWIATEYDHEAMQHGFDNRLPIH